MASNTAPKIGIYQHCLPYFKKAEDWAFDADEIIVQKGVVSGLITVIRCKTPYTKPLSTLE